MEHVQNVSASLQFNHGQCEYLLGKLTMAVQSAEALAELDPSVFKSKRTETMKLLWRSAKEVESFTQGCCNDNWIQATSILWNMSAFVSSLGSNLDLCISLLLKDNTVGTSQNWKQNWEQHFHGLNAYESEVVKERVSSDHRKLLTRLETVILSGNSSHKDYQLAKCLSRKLSQDLEGSFLLEVWNIEFSKLRQVQRLGSGSVGTVCKSIWLDGQIEVAEKMFYGSDHPSFDNEVQILAGLAHPNITPLLGYAVDEGKCSIIMELMDEDLLFHMEARLRENVSCKSPFTLFEAVNMMLQIAEGMLYLHGNKVVHRDQKSQNILVKRRKDIDADYVYLKVADFGLSKTKENSITHSNQTPNTGTPRWMASELMTMGANDFLARDHELRYPFKVDIYSFGMVCYELLTGKVPFSTVCSIKEVKRMVLNGDRPILPDECPQSLKTLILSCWNSEASLRPSFEEICKELRFLRYFLLTEEEEMTQKKEFKGVSRLKGNRGYSAEIRHPKWKKIWLGMYHTDREAAAAYDAGTFYCNKKTKFNFPYLKETFPPLPSELLIDSADNFQNEIKLFIEKEAQLAAGRINKMPPANSIAVSSVL